MNLSERANHNKFLEDFLKMKVRSGGAGKRKAGKKTKELLRMVISSPKHKVPTCVYSPFTVVVSENIFCQGMVALLNPVCGFLYGMLLFDKREVRVAIFET